MATPAELFSQSDCTACSGAATLFQTLEIQTLLNILIALGDPMTQAQIQAASNCYVCFGMSQAEAAILVLLNAISVAVGGGGAGGFVEAQSGNYGGAQPPWVPGTGFGFAWDTSTDPDTEWNYHDGAWH